MKTPQELKLPEKFTAWRPGQGELVEKIARSQEKFFLLDAPTGTGKSLIGMAVHKTRLAGKDEREILSRLSDRPESDFKDKCIYITRTKQLQDQILQDFPTARTLKGRNNYPCAKHPDEFPEYTAEDCTCSSPMSCVGKDKKPVSCAYYWAKREAVKAPLTVLNSSYYLTEVNGPGQFNDVSLVIIDEVDSMEGDLMNHIQLQVTTTQLNRFNLDLPKDPHSLQGWMAWASMVEIDPIAARMEKQLELIPEDNWTDVEIRLNRQNTQLRNFQRKLAEFQLEVDDTWLFSEVQREKDTVFTFKPVQIRNYADRYLWDHAQSFLGMSGTILDPGIMAHDMGIEDWAYANSECPFPLHHRPIYYDPVVNLTRKTMDTELPKLARAIIDIMNAYPNDKILVHTTSFAIRNYLHSWISDDSRLISHTTENREHMLSFFKRSRDPLVMLSPSFDRGVDLRDDFCRCVIICKVPYISMGDPQVRARMKLPGGDRWYLLKAIQTIIQMSGRGVRSELDYCDCVYPETRILTADLNWKVAAYLKVGDKILGFDEQTSLLNPRKWRWASVEAMGIKELPRYKIMLENGKMLISTPNHRWLSKSGQSKNDQWLRTDQLKVGHHLNRYVNVWENTSNSWDTGWLAGLFDGEGSLISPTAPGSAVRS
ncbi:MAG TPA: hypothetical protein ENI27_10555 [bacterium]|nr:hypothetical protein [bacterium]